MEAIAEKYKNMIWPKEPPTLPILPQKTTHPPLMRKNKDPTFDEGSRSLSSLSLDPVPDSSKQKINKTRRPKSAPESTIDPIKPIKSSTSSRSGSATRNSVNTHDILAVTKTEMVSSVGRRDYQEDVILCPKELINDRFQVAFVFDGHSGGLASNYLNTNLIKLLPQFFTYEMTGSAIPNTIVTIISKLGTEFKKKKKTDGSTISGVLVDTVENMIYVVNIGDSVTMLYGIQGKVIFVSNRDSTDNATERQRLTSLGIPVEKDANAMWRMYGLNMSKAFGDFHTGLLEDALNKSGRKVQVNAIPMPKGLQNINIIIASDGLFDEIQPEHLAQVSILRKLKLEDLMRFVLDHGFKGDNFSAIKLQLSRQRKQT